MDKINWYSDEALLAMHLVTLAYYYDRKKYSLSERLGMATRVHVRNYRIMFPKFRDDKYFSETLIPVRCYIALLVAGQYDTHFRCVCICEEKMHSHIVLSHLKEDWRAHAEDVEWRRLHGLSNFPTAGSLF